MGVPVNGADFSPDPQALQTASLLDGLLSWPLLLAAAVILIGLGWLLRGGGRKARDNADAIQEAISKAASRALEADSADLPGRATALKRVLDDRLGATARLTGGRSELIAALDAALDGRPHTPHHASDHDAHEDHGPAEAHEAAHAHGAAPTTQVIINTGNADPAHAPRHGAHPPANLSPKAREQALRLAVADINEHWRQGAARKAELRAAHRELSAPCRFP